MRSLTNYIKLESIDYLKDLLKNITHFYKANDLIFNVCGIIDFFENQKEYSYFLDLLISPKLRVSDVVRREYGDFQTPIQLTEQVCSFLISNKVNPNSIIEPTFGKGSFILSSLKYFKNIRYIFGIEIYDEYFWYTKLKILDFFIDHPEINKPSIHLFKANIFNFNCDSIKKYINDKILVIGNPPWVTNTELSTLNSCNLPQKSNFKNHSGIDAITGKGNFDIGEYITLLMLKHFSSHKGDISLLLKNSVIKNLLYDLFKNNYKISNLKSFNIDAKKYFNAAVNASLFTASFKQQYPTYICQNFNFKSPKSEISKFGWFNSKFISNINDYEKNSKYDSVSPLEWRQGVKHDSSKVFELTKLNNKYYNGFNEEIDVENDLIYGLIKSSDLKRLIIQENRKYVIITQKYIGQDTSYISHKYPKLFNYLKSKEKILNNRKSSIYKNKPSFSIFGIGDYSFKPFKIAISGLYKKSSFSLLLPVHNKTLMVDDTCYSLSFDCLSDALFTLAILIDIRTQDLLKSIIFTEAKRPYTKDILMRIAIDEIAHDLGYDQIFDRIKGFNSQFSNEINFSNWESYVLSFSKFKSTQLSLV